jgi:hypothetical protein
MVLSLCKCGTPWPGNMHACPTTVRPCSGRHGLVHARGFSRIVHNAVYKRPCAGEHAPVQFSAKQCNLVWFRPMAAARISPLADDAVIKKIPLQCFPRDLFVLGRTIMLLRGLTHALDLDVQVPPISVHGGICFCSDAAHVSCSAAAAHECLHVNPLYALHAHAPVVAVNVWIAASLGPLKGR